MLELEYYIQLYIYNIKRLLIASYRDNSNGKWELILTPTQPIRIPKASNDYLQTVISIYECDRNNKNKNKLGNKGLKQE